MKNFTIYSVAVFLLLFSNFTNAANISSKAAGGNWNVASTWTGNIVPTTADNVTIISGSTVTVNTNITCMDLIVQGTLINSSFNISITGNLDVSGTFNSGIGLITCTGSSKTFNGNIVLSNLTINGNYTNMGTLTVTGNLAGSGMLTQNINASLYLQNTVSITNLIASASPNNVTYNGSVPVTVKGTTYYNLMISVPGVATAGGTISVNGNLDIQNGCSLNDNGYQINGNATGSFNMGTGTMLVLGNPSVATLFPGNFTTANIHFNANSIVKYNSGQPQTISGVPVYESLELISSGTVTKTAGSNLTVNNTLTVGSNNTLNMGTNSLIIYNDFINNGVFSSNGDVTFTGTNHQTIGGSFPTTFKNLLINKTDSLVVLMLETSVNGQLVLTNGKILTNNTNKLILNSTGTVSGGSNVSYIEGPIQKYGNTSFTFPTGKNGIYQPIGISPPDSITDAFIAEYFNHNSTIDGIATNSVQTGLDHVSKAEYWNLTRNSGISDVLVTLFWNTGSGVTSIPDIKVAGWNGTLWMNYGGTSNGSVSSGTVTSTGTPLTYFAFTLASSTAQNLLGGMSITISSTNVSCYGGNNGSAIVNISGGTAPYTYKWSNLQNTQSAVNLAAGTYNVTVKDVSLDSLVGSVTITQPNNLFQTANHTNISCYGGNNGSITIFSSGGNSPYQYSINNGATFSSANNFNLLSAGTFMLIVKDANNCTTNPISVNLVQPPALIVNAGNPGIICNGFNFDIGGFPTASGGSPGYTFNWSSIPAGFTSVVSNPTVTPAATTQYTVTVTDINGCQSNAGVNVTVNPLPNVNTGSDLFICAGSSGVINANAFGNNYSWSPATGLTDTLFVNPTASPSVTTSYIMMVTDVNGCINRDTVVVNVIPLPDVTATPTAQSVCSGQAANIALTSTISGTSFNWTVSQNNVSGGTTGSGITISELLTNNGTVNGTATYTITPVSNGCAGSQVNADITVYPQSLGGSVVASPASVCYNSSSVLSLSGNTGTIIWQESSDGLTWSDITGETGSTYTTPNLLFTTYYRASVTSGTGCSPSNSNMVMIIVNTLPLANAGTDQLICSGQSASLTASGGASYLWSNGATTSSITVSSAVTTTYTVTVSDANGCSAQDTVIVNIASTPSSSVSTTNPTCFGYCDGSASVSVTGGTSPYTYLWSNAGTNTILTGACAGLYTVTITDTNGCSAVSNFSISEPPAFSGTVSSTNVTCYGGNDGTATAGGTGGMLPYTYLWFNGFTAPVLSNLSAGSYSVSISDANGCGNLPYYANVSQPPAVIANAGADQTICSGQSVTINASGGVSYLWSNGSDSISINVAPVETTGFTVTVTDANSCTGIDDVIINVNSPTGSSLVQVACDSFDLNGTAYNASGVYTQTLVNSLGCDSTITLNLTINNATSSSLVQSACGNYNLNGIDYTTSGIYTQTLVNSAGCDSIITLDLTINNATSSSLVQTSCGSFDLNGTIYNASGVYTQTLVNTSGCDSVITLNLTINPLPQVTFTGLPVSLCAVPQYYMLIGNQVPNGIFSGAGLINNAFNPSVAGVGSHNINYTYTDINGCTSTDIQQIIVNSNPSMQIVSISPSTCGNANGSVTIDGMNGVAPYVFQWSTGAAFSTISNLTTGVYVVTITDSNGCSGIASVNITSSDGPVINVNSITNSSCNYTVDGTSDISVTGGAEPYTFLWSDGETTEDALHLAEGTNSVTVTDINNCNSVTSVNILSNFETPAIFGRISYYGGFIDGQFATLKIFSLINNNDGGYDTTTREAAIGSDGTYVLYNFEPGQYILKVLLQSNPYANLLNSYYSTSVTSTHKWQEATPIILGCGQDVEANIMMFEHLNNGSGNGHINGTIVQNNTGSKSRGVHINPAKLVGEPVPGAEIYVELEPDDQPIMNTETDTAGFYFFEELPQGDYSIRVEIPGFPMISTYQVVITPTDTAFPDLDFIVDYTADSGFVDTSLVSINNKYDVADIVNVYPNPFVETLNVGYTINKSKVICIDVFDATGRLIETTGKIRQNEGSYFYNLNSEKKQLLPGTYFVQFRADNTVYLKKTVKIK